MEDKDCKILSTKYQGEKFKQIRRNGIFLYDFLHRFEKFKGNQLPEIDSFYHFLSEENCSIDDYNFAKRCGKLSIVIPYEII